VHHKKSSVRGLSCALWRPLAWAYFRAPLTHTSYEDEGKGEEEWKAERTMTKAVVWAQAEEARREDFWKVIARMGDMGAGVGTVAALLTHKSDDVGSISWAIALLECIVQRGSLCCDAVQTLCRLVPTPPSSTARCDQGMKTYEEGLGLGSCSMTVCPVLI
jgi:hypothetical protein